MTDRKPQVLYFTGAHCATCRRMAPRVQETANDFRDRVDLVEIDVAADADQVAEHSVRAVPTLVAVHDGTVVGRAVGGRAGRLSTRSSRALWRVDCVRFPCRPPTGRCAWVPPPRSG
jgi:thioredoxin 1